MLWNFIRTYLAERQVLAGLRSIHSSLAKQRGQSHIVHQVDKDSLEELRRVVRAQHPESAEHDKHMCACGAPRGGPAATPACLALLELLLRSERLARTTREIHIDAPH